MRILKKLPIYTPKTSISNSDSVLNKKLERNSRRILGIESDLAKGKIGSIRAQKHISKLLTKESYLIKVKDLKTRFMIQAPEDFDENSDVLKEKHKIYTDMHTTVTALYKDLENRSISQEGITMQMASKSLGDIQGVVNALFSIVTDELIPMAHDGVGLLGYLGLKRNLQELLQQIKDSQKGLMNSVGKESVDRKNNIINYNMLLTDDQNDAIEMVSKSAKQSLATLLALLEVSLSGHSPRVSEEGTLTEEGKRLGGAIKKSLQSLLNAADLSRDGDPSNELLMQTMPFLKDIDISQCNLSLAREGFDVMKSKIEEKLGALGEGVVNKEIVELAIGADGAIDVADNDIEKEAVENRDDEEDDIDSIDDTESISDTSSVHSNEEEQKNTITVEKMVCKPFLNCTSTDDVLAIIEKLSELTLEDGSPAIDMQNVCIVLAQTIKREINLGQKSIMLVNPIPKSRVYYTMGNDIYGREENTTKKSNIFFSGTKGVLALADIPFTNDRILRARDNYLSSIARSADAITALIKSIESPQEFNALLHSGEEDIQENENEICDKEDSNEKNERSPSVMSIGERKIHTSGELFLEKIDHITQLFNGGIDRREILEGLGDPRKAPLLRNFMQSEEFMSFVQKNSDATVKQGLPILVEWIMNVSDDIIERKVKEDILMSCTLITGSAIQKISPTIQRYVTGLGNNVDQVKDLQYRYGSKEEFDTLKKHYQKRIQQHPDFTKLTIQQQEAILELLVVQGDMRILWEKMLTK